MTIISFKDFFPIDAIGTLWHYKEVFSDDWFSISYKTVEHADGYIDIAIDPIGDYNLNGFFDRIQIRDDSLLLKQLRVYDTLLPLDPPFVIGSDTKVKEEYTGIYPDDLITWTNPPFTAKVHTKAVRQKDIDGVSHTYFKLIIKIRSINQKIFTMRFLWNSKLGLFSVHGIIEGVSILYKRTLSSPPPPVNDNLNSLQLIKLAGLFRLTDTEFLNRETDARGMLHSSPSGWYGKDIGLIPKQIKRDGSPYPQLKLLSIFWQEHSIRVSVPPMLIADTITSIRPNKVFEHSFKPVPSWQNVTEINLTIRWINEDEGGWARVSGGPFGHIDVSHFLYVYAEAITQPPYKMFIEQFIGLNEDFGIVRVAHHGTYIEKTYWDLASDPVSD